MADCSEAKQQYDAMLARERAEEREKQAKAKLKIEHEETMHKNALLNSLMRGEYSETARLSIDSAPAVATLWQCREMTDEIVNLYRAINKRVVEASTYREAADQILQLAGVENEAVRSDLEEFFRDQDSKVEQIIKAIDNEVMG